MRHGGARVAVPVCLRHRACHLVSALTALGGERAKYYRDHRNCGVPCPKPIRSGAVFPYNECAPVSTAFRCSARVRATASYLNHLHFLVKGLRMLRRPRCRRYCPVAPQCGAPRRAMGIWVRRGECRKPVAWPTPVPSPNDHRDKQPHIDTHLSFGCMPSVNRFHLCGGGGGSRIKQKA